jgi:hypothetical protein
MWSLFVTALGVLTNLYVSGVVWQGLQSRADTKKDTNHNEIDLRAHNIDIIIDLFVNTTRREGIVHAT